LTHPSLPHSLLLFSKQLTRVQAGAAASDDDDWRKIISSEANLSNYLGEEGFRYNMNQTPEEEKKEGWNLFSKIFGATSNNAARMSARSYGRALTIDVYDAAKAAENKEWIAKYGYKRWGTSYVDKSDLETEKGAAAASLAVKTATPAPKAASKLAFSFPKLGGGAKSEAAPAKKTSAVKVSAKPVASPVAPAAAAPKVKAAAPPTGPLSGRPQAQGKGNLDLLKKK